MMRRGFIAALLCALFACAPADVGPKPPPAAAPAWIEALARTHAEVDHFLDQKDLVAARARLEHMIAAARPRDLPDEEKRALVQDLHARLAELLILLGDFAAAAKTASDGLALGARSDVFTANLLVAEGHALERLGREEEAVERYHSALEINEALLQKELSRESPN